VIFDGASNIQSLTKPPGVVLMFQEFEAEEEEEEDEEGDDDDNDDQGEYT
jgi:hypothetical protein